MWYRERTNPQTPKTGVAAGRLTIFQYLHHQLSKRKTLLRRMVKRFASNSNLCRRGGGMLLRSATLDLGEPLRFFPPFSFAVHFSPSSHCCPTAKGTRHVFKVTMYPVPREVFLYGCGIKANVPQALEKWEREQICSSGLSVPSVRLPTRQCNHSSSV